VILQAVQIGEQSATEADGPVGTSPSRDFQEELSALAAKVQPGVLSNTTQLSLSDYGVRRVFTSRAPGPNQ
jgi:hypothetical protein